MEHEIIRSIGKGGFSKVCLVDRNGNKLARKQIEITPGCFKSIEKEVTILKELRDRNVIIYKDSLLVESENRLYIYTEYLENGDLWNIIDKRKKMKKDLSLKEIVSYMKDLINGLKYIHGKGIIHRDLKPGNILVGDHNELIICDFGLATEDDKIDNKLAGTYNYMAPELYSNNPPPYSTASDIFSLGCILYEIYTLSKAYDGSDKEIRNDILSNKELIFDRISGNRIPKIEELIKRMLEKDVNSRIELSEIEEKIKVMAIPHTLPLPSPNISDCSLPLISTSISTNITSGESDSLISFSNYKSLILNFYLENGAIKCKTLEEISIMNLVEFGSYWDDDLLSIFFPSLNQDNPPFSSEDLYVLKNNKDKYLNDLHSLIYLIELNEHHISSIIQFLNLIDDIDYIDKLNEKKKHADYEDKYIKGDSSRKSKDYAKAVKYYQSALEYTSTNEEKYWCNFKIGMNYYDIKDYHKSREFYEAALEYALTNERKYLCNYNLGKDYDRSIKYYQSSLDYASTNETKCLCNYNLGVNYMIIKDYDRSIKYYQSSLDYALTNERIYLCNYNLGKDYHKSREFYETALEYALTNERKYLCNYNLGKDYDKAIKFYESSFDYASTNIQNYKCYIRMCECLFKLNKRKESIDCFDKAIKFAKGDYDKFDCNNVIGKCYFDNNEIEESIKYLNEANKYISSVKSEEERNEFEEMFNKINK